MTSPLAISSERTRTRRLSVACSQPVSRSRSEAANIEHQYRKPIAFFPPAELESCQIRAYPEERCAASQRVQGSEHYRPAVRLVEVARRYGGGVPDRRPRTQRKRPGRRHARTSRAIEPAPRRGRLERAQADGREPDGDARRRADARQVHAQGHAEPDRVRRSGRHARAAALRRQAPVDLRRNGRRARGPRQPTRRAAARRDVERCSASASASRCFAATPRATSAIRRAAKALAGICAAHDHVHRKTDDILAEFLLDQQDVQAVVGKS